VPQPGAEPRSSVSMPRRAEPAAGDDWRVSAAAFSAASCSRFASCADRRPGSGGEGFEPSIRLTTDSGFRDRRVVVTGHRPGRAVLTWQHLRRPPAVHQVVFSSHLQSAPVRGKAHGTRPGVTGADWSGHRSIPRNEGVPGSSPGVGCLDLQGFLTLDRGLSEGLRGPPEVYVSEVLPGRGHFCRRFPLRLGQREVRRGCPLQSPRVTSSRD
jgi:hypothetical protein